MDVTPLVRLCEEAVLRGIFPGAAFSIGTPDGEWLGSAGRLGLGSEWPNVTGDSIYDLASLTKVVVTTTVTMVLHDEGRLRLDDAVSELLQGFTGAGKERVRLRDLLTHDSGLPAYGRYEGVCSTSDEVRAAILREPLVAAPGERTEYSCLNAVLLQMCLESLEGRGLDELARDLLFCPLKMRHTGFNPPQSWFERIAPTTRAEPWRARFHPNGPTAGDWLRGLVHDPIAFMLGGVSGNAGLFSTARDLARFARMMLGFGRFEGKRLIREDTVQDWTRRQSVGGTRALGWDTKSPLGSSAGSMLSDRSYGHTGYTGTSLWLDPENGWFVVLLSNRVHAGESDEGIADFRRRFHDAAAQILRRA